MWHLHDGCTNLHEFPISEGQKIFVPEINNVPEVNMSLLRKMVRWFQFRSRPRIERNWDEIRLHQQTTEEVERIKARAFYLSRGF
jgi:hypothetical protein